MTPPADIAPGAAPQTSAPRTLCLKHILVPYDFSSSATLALQHAVAHARQFRSDLTLLHVVHLPFRGVGFGPGEPHGIEGPLLAETTKQLTTLAEELKQQKLVAKAIVRLGYPAHDIVEITRQELIDLIVMGTHGRTGLKRALLGSVASNVVRHAPCPVLVVREQTNECGKE